MTSGNVFFHSISENVKDALIIRQKANSNPNYGEGPGSAEFDRYTKSMTWRYRKNAWANLYWHCPTGKYKDELICGSDFVNYNIKDDFTKIKRSNYPINDNDKSSLYEPISSKDNRKIQIMMLQSVNITNEGRIGSLQKATIEIKVHSMKQLEEIESKILFPGADIRVEYGWTGGLGPVTKFDNPDKDNFVGIVSNFSWNLNEDLTVLVTLTAVGKGFVLTALPATGMTRLALQDISDENENKQYANAFITKIKKDIKTLNNSNAVPGKWYKIENPGNEYQFVYGVQTIKSDASVTPTVTNTTGDANGLWSKKDSDTNKSPADKVCYYIKLSDIFNYFNQVVLSKIPRISDGKNLYNVKFSANYGIDKTGRNGEQEKENLKNFFMPCSISMLDKEIVSADPSRVLFNGCANYEKVYSPNSKYDLTIQQDDSNDWAHATFIRPAGDEGYGTNNCGYSGGVNLGEILIGVDLIIELMENVVSRQREPFAKSVQALGEHLFTEINNLSGNLYQLSWIEIEVTKYGKTEETENGLYKESWICVTDSQYTVCNPDKWTFGIERPDTSLVKKISLASKIPNNLMTALYVSGRSIQNNIAAIDTVFSTAGNVAIPWWLIKDKGNNENRNRTRDCQFYANEDLDNATISNTSNSSYNDGLVTSGNGGSSLSATPRMIKAVEPYEAIIKEAAVKYNLDPNLIKAVIYQESKGNPNAGSNKGAKGLMQLMDPTARELGVNNSYDPRENIMGGSKYLAQQFNKFKQENLALAAYNAGPNKVIKANYNIPNYKETKEYVPSVKSYRDQYKNYENAKLQGQTNLIGEKNYSSTKKRYSPDYNLGGSKYFKLKDFYCKDKNNNTTIAPPDMLVPNIEALAKQLDKLTDQFGGRSRFRINSAYRTPERNKYNTSGGGVINSAHMLGKAVDISPVPPLTLDTMVALTQAAMNSGVITKGFINKYPDKNFMHYDIGPSNNREKIHGLELKKVYGEDFVTKYNSLKKGQDISALEEDGTKTTTDSFESSNLVQESSYNFSLETTDPETSAEILKQMKQKAGNTGFSKENISDLRIALLQYVSLQKAALVKGNSDAYSFVRRDLYPLECTIVLEGIAGFRFGDAVMVDYLPNRYKENLCFMVTKVQHTIVKGGWETTLLLQAKVISDVSNTTEERKDGIGKGRAIQNELNPIIRGREYEENVDFDVSQNNPDRVDNKAPLDTSMNSEPVKYSERKNNERPTKIHPADK